MYALIKKRQGRKYTYKYTQKKMIGLRLIDRSLVGILQQQGNHAFMMTIDPIKRSSQYIVFYAASSIQLHLVYHLGTKIHTI